MVRGGGSIGIGVPMHAYNKFGIEMIKSIGASFGQCVEFKRLN